MLPTKKNQWSSVILMKPWRAELTGVRAEEIPGTLTPLVPSLQDLQGLETVAVPAEPETLDASPPGVPDMTS